MRRVHRDLSRDEVEALRDKLSELVPQQKASIPEILRTMRLIVRMSQAEYAHLCGVSHRALAGIEAGGTAASTATLQKLLRPFGLTVGIVSPPGRG